MSLMERERGREGESEGIKKKKVSVWMERDKRKEKEEQINKEVGEERKVTYTIISRTGPPTHLRRKEPAEIE